MPESTQTTNPDIENRFTYHPPKPGQPRQYVEIREQAKNLAYTFNRECPSSRERSLALTKLEEAVFHANAAIARHGEAVPDGAEPDDFSTERSIEDALPDSFTPEQVARFTTRKMEAQDLSKASDNYGPRVAIVCQARDREKYEDKHPSARVLVPGDATMGWRFDHIIIYGEASDAGSEWHKTSLATRATKDCKWEYLAAVEPVRASSTGAIEDSPVYALKQAFLHDRDYLLGWHANIACAVEDAIPTDAISEHATRWGMAQEAARRFIGVLFAGDAQKPIPITDEEVRGGLKDDCISQPDALSEDSEEALEGAEILFGFMGWLTSRKQSSTFGASVEASSTVDLIKLFCTVNGISDHCRDDWGSRLIHPAEAPPILQPDLDPGPMPFITDEVLIDLLGLVDVTVTRAQMSVWTVDQAKEAEEWAGAVHRAARLDAGIPGAPALRCSPPKPRFLPESDTDLRLADPPPVRLEPDDEHSLDSPGLEPDDDYNS